MTKLLWAFLLIEFVALNVYAFAVADLWDYLSNMGPFGWVGIADLLIALAIAVVWMWRDARAKGVKPLPYALLTVATGSPGLLVYLLRHGGAPKSMSPTA